MMLASSDCDNSPWWYQRSVSYIQYTHGKFLFLVWKNALACFLTRFRTHGRNLPYTVAGTIIVRNDGIKQNLTQETAQVARESWCKFLPACIGKLYAHCLLKASSFLKSMWRMKFRQCHNNFKLITHELLLQQNVNLSCLLLEWRLYASVNEPYLVQIMAYRLISPKLLETNFS